MTFAPATVAPMINANVIRYPNPNPNPNHNLNPYPTRNQKPDHYRTLTVTLCCWRSRCRRNCRRSKCRITKLIC